MDIKTVVSHIPRVYDGPRRLYAVHLNPRWEMWTFPATKIRQGETLQQAHSRLLEEFRLKDRPMTRYHRHLPVLEQQLFSPGTNKFTDYRHLTYLENLRAPKRADRRWTPHGWQWLAEDELLAHDRVSPTAKALLAPSHLLPALPSPEDCSLSAQMIRAFYNPVCFHEFLERHRSELEATLHCNTQMQSTDIEDFLQEAWLRIWLRRDEYVPGTNPLSWVLAIAQNLGRDARRSSRRRRVFGEAGLEEAPSNCMTPMDAVHRQEDSLHFSRLVRPLSPRDRLLARLHYVENLSPKEIAECLGRRPGTIHSKLSHIRNQLAEFYGPQGH